MTRIMLIVFLLFGDLTLAQKIDGAQIRTKADALSSEDLEKCKETASEIVDLSFDFSFRLSDTKALEDPSNYIVLDVEAVQRIPVECLNISDGTVFLHFGQKAQFSKDRSYHVFVRNLKFGAAEAKELEAPITIPTEKAGLAWKAEKAGSRTAAHIYIAGDAQRSSGGDLIGGADIRIAPLIYPDPENSRHELYPVFDLKWSSDPAADPDTLETGLEYRFHAGLNWPFPFSSSWTYLMPKLESDRSFDHTNFVTEARWLPFVFQAGPLQRRTTIEPFIGVELGKNLKSPLAATDGAAVARPMVRIDLVTPLFGSSKGSLERIGLEASWQRRWPLKDEVFFEQGDDQTLVPVRFGQGPKDYVEAKLSFGLERSFDIFLAYKYGQLPPLYKLVNHQASLGIRYAVKFKPSQK